MNEGFESGGAVDYDRIAAHYDTHRGWRDDTPRRILRAAYGEHLARETGAATLELGCGTGNLTAWLMEAAPGPVAAVDLSLGMLRKAKQKLPRAQLVRADARRLPFAAGQFAAAVGSHFLHYLDATARADLFAELMRVLRRPEPAGVAFLTVGHEQIRACALTRWFPSVAGIDCARFPDLPVLEAELAAAGFQEVRVETVDRPDPAGTRAYLEKVRGRFISTLELVPADEFSRGLAAMGRDLARDGHLGDVSWHGTVVSAVAGQGTLA